MFYYTFVFLCPLLSLLGCGEKITPVEVGVQKIAKPPTLADVPAFTEVDPAKLELELSDGKAMEEGEVEAVSTNPGVPLSTVETTKLLQRLPKIQSKQDDKKSFMKRKKSLPLPKKEVVIKQQFPPKNGSSLLPNDSTVAKELEVLRYAPVGAVPIVPQVSITFNQPMIPLTSLQEQKKLQVPIQIVPQVAGSWRWVGTKTLLFKPEKKRFPMATEFTVQLKKNVVSAFGKTLNKEQSWSFQTPPPKVSTVWPRDGYHHLKQPIFIAFDQNIEPKKILPYLTLTSPKTAFDTSLRLVSLEDIEDKVIRNLVKKSNPDQWLIVQSKKKLPYDAQLDLRVKKGVPGTEGPLISTEEQVFSFRTYGALKVVESSCGYRTCEPSSRIQIHFSNSLDTESFHSELVHIEPPIPNVRIQARGRTLSIQGIKNGETTYKVTLSKDILDVYKQNRKALSTHTFRVGPAAANMLRSWHQLVVLDPVAEPTVSVFTTNYTALNVQVYEVQPNDWADYQMYRGNSYSINEGQHKVPGKRTANQKVEIAHIMNQQVETKISLQKWLANGLGNLVIRITPSETAKGVKMPRYPTVIRRWVQATQIGLDAFVDGEYLLARTTSLRDGSPLQGVSLRLGTSKLQAMSDANGLAKMPLKKGEGTFLQATLGQDIAFLTNGRYGTGNVWKQRPVSDTEKWFVFDDRKIYKPKEKVHIKGWIRTIENHKNGGVRLPAELGTISYLVRGTRGNKITEGTVEATAFGGFDFQFVVPDTANLGKAQIVLKTKASSYVHRFRIEEFRRPEFVVQASAGTGPYLADEEMTLQVTANYYAGGSLAGAKTSWKVSTTDAFFTPPNQNKFQFGVVQPWWLRSPNAQQRTELRHQGKTDALGVHHLLIRSSRIDGPRPLTVRANASVEDVNLQSWSAKTSLLLHPSLHYVGLKTDTYFVEQGKPLQVQAIVTDIAGKPLSNRPVKLRAGRLDWTYEKGKYTSKLVDVQACDKLTSDGGLSCSFTTKVGGQYRIVATTMDDFGRTNVTQISRWVAGHKVIQRRSLKQDKVTLIPDKEIYQPGETAKILVQSPFVPADGILSLRRNGMIKEKHFRMEKSTTTLEVDIKNVHLPNLYVQVDLVGATPRTDDEGKVDLKIAPRPAFAKGSVNLKIPPKKRTLQVVTKAQKEFVSPGETTAVSVLVKDAAGQPLQNAEVALLVVDEAVLALSQYKMADPVSLFYAHRPAGVTDHHLRQHVDLARHQDLVQGSGLGGGGEASGLGGLGSKGMGRGRSGYGSGGGGASFGKKKKSAALRSTQDVFAAAPMFGQVDADRGAGDPVIGVRNDFNPLAAFAGAVFTNKQGEATLTYKIPDNLTRYRIMAVAVHGDNLFGSHESAVTARLPLMLRPSPPRFLQFGDQFALPVVIQNQTDKNMDIQIAARTSNLKLTKYQGLKASIPAGERQQFLFPATTEEAGIARMQFAVAAAGYSDAAEVSLPVWTPATSEAFASYGVIDKGAISQPLKVPKDIWSQYGGLDIRTSSTALQSLTDAFIYIYKYPYGCSEQISSRILTAVALQDVLTAFEAPGMPNKEKLQQAMQRDIKKLLSRQHRAGEFGFWRRSGKSYPYVNVHVAHALFRAHKKGYKVPKYQLQSILRYLQRVERSIPRTYSKEARYMVRVYALYVRSLVGDKDERKARLLVQKSQSFNNPPLEAFGWLLHVLSHDKDAEKQRAILRKYLGNRITETASGAHFVSRYDDKAQVIMRSSRRADGVILEALIDTQPDSDLIPKLVNGLLDHRKKGRWSNTQDNAFVLLALDKYFQRYEKQKPDFVAKAWLGQDYAGEHRFRGRTVERHHIEIPMSQLTEGAAEKNIYLQKQGAGRMYYRLGMRYAPTDLFVKAEESGFSVTRRYEAVDNPADVQQEPDGTWKVRAGAKVKVNIQIVAPGRRYHVAMVDPLPAGLEILNPALAITDSVPNQVSTKQRWWWWSRPWYDHQNMRDERAEAFARMMWGGVYNYSYYAKATTTGTFIVPPTKAEEMYHPETFGRSASTKVVVFAD